MDIKGIFFYDELNGNLIWKQKFKNIEIGDVAGGLDDKGYRVIQVNNKQWKAHRLVWEWHNGYTPENDIDHINKIRHDNRIENLREVSNQCNQRNKNVSKTNTSGVAGVTWNRFRNKWQSQIKVNFKQIYLGRYTDFNDAVTARHKAEVEHGWHNCNSTSSAFLYLQERGLIND